MDTHPIELGDRVRDKITGFTGIVIGITDWIHGCRRPIVQGESLDSDGKLVPSESFDEPQLQVVSRAVLTPTRPGVEHGERTGGPAQTPSGRSTPRRT